VSLNALIRWLKPKETVFFDLLEASAANLVTASKVLSDGFRSANDDAEALMELRCEVKGLEHKGDEITHELLDQLDRAFVTPIEREDILALAHALDDVADCMDAAAERIVLYKITHLLPIAIDMSNLLVEGTQTLFPMIQALRKMSDVKDIRNRIHEITRLENQSDALYHAALACLFENPTDPIYLMKWKELFKLLEDAMDRIELVAKVVGSTVMRNA